VDSADQAAIDQAVTTGTQHRAVDVADRDRTRRADPWCEQRGDVARAPREVENAVTRAHAAGGDEMALPQAMHAERHEVVHDVVLARDRGEDFIHEPGFFRFRHFAITEMRVRRFVHRVILSRGGWALRTRIIHATGLLRSTRRDTPACAPVAARP